MPRCQWRLSHLQAPRPQQPSCVLTQSTALIPVSLSMAFSKPCLPCRGHSVKAVPVPAVLGVPLRVGCAVWGLSQRHFVLLQPFLSALSANEAPEALQSLSTSDLDGVQAFEAGWFSTPVPQAVSVCTWTRYTVLCACASAGWAANCTCRDTSAHEKPDNVLRVSSHVQDEAP